MMRYDCLIHEKLLHTDTIPGAVISLKLQGFYPAHDAHDLPNYSFFMMLADQIIGKITLRLGYNELTLIQGHIGYEIDEAYRGYGYSYYALSMILELARAHGFQSVLVTCDPSNVRSIKSVLKVGGKMIYHMKEVPKDHIYYVLGITHLNVYSIDLI